MHNDSKWPEITTLSAVVTGTAQAAPIDGELGSNAAVLLLLLGIWALLMGMRNLRDLRHKRLVLKRDEQNARMQHVKTPNPEAQG